MFSHVKGQSLKKYFSCVITFSSNCDDETMVALLKVNARFLSAKIKAQRVRKIGKILRTTLEKNEAK